MELSHVLGHGAVAYNDQLWQNMRAPPDNQFIIE